MTPMICIPRGGEVAWTGPSAFGKARLYAFAVRADGLLVHEMLARYIAQPSADLGLHVDVRGTTLDHVFFVFLDSERRQRPLGSAQGFEGAHAEQLFAIIALGYRIHPNPGLVLFAPYVYSSDTPGWRAEREIYGYPQQQGRVSVRRQGASPPDYLSVSAKVIEQFRTTATAKDREIVRITRNPNATAGRSRTVTAAQLVKSIAEQLGVKQIRPRGPIAATVLPRPRLGATAADISFCERRSGRIAEPTTRDPPPIVDITKTQMSGTLPMLFLKQFRDIVHSDRACYQAIVEAPLEIEGDISQTPLKGYVLDLADTDSVPIRRELGIPTGVVPVDFAFELTVNELAFDRAHVISNPYWNPATEPEREGELSRLPVYVDRGGEAVWRQPSLIYGARIYGFGVNVPVQRQQDLLNRCVNNVAKESQSTYGSTKFELRAIRDMVLLLFVEYERISSGTDDDKRLGGVSYREFLAMQLTESRDDEFPEINWFIPFIYLDADAPRLGGREIFGYPKQLGRIEPFERYLDGSRKLEPAKELELSATVFRSAAKSVTSHNSVIRIQGPENGPPTIERRYVDAGTMLADLVMVGVGRRMMGIENALLAGNVGNVFLKQFRDCENPEKPCYQAVCKTDTIPGRFRGGGRLDPKDYRITVQNLASEPLLSYISGPGAKGRQAAFQPMFAYWLDLDFELTNGRVIANPLATGYVPDLSFGRTRLDTMGGVRICRRSGQTEPDTPEDLERMAELTREGGSIV